MTRCACRCPDVERYIRQTNPNKKIILLLNKMGECYIGPPSSANFGKLICTPLFQTVFGTRSGR